MGETAGLWQVGAEGSKPVPLKRVEASCQVRQECASVTLKHEFVNPEDKNIEAIYVLPISEQAAICYFEAQIAGRKVVGVSKEKQKAKKEYKEAIAQGHGAYLLEKKKDDCFEMKVGNVPPKQTVIITLTYVTQLELTDQSINFLLPVSVLPPLQEGEEEEKVMAYELKISVSLGMGANIEDVNSPSHSINFSDEGQGEGMVLVDTNTVLATDFILQIRVHDTNEPVVCAEYNEKTTSSAVYLSFVPRLSEEDEEGIQPKHELIFLLDCSNSMKGPSSVYLRNTLDTMLDELPETVIFNVITFGSQSEKLFPDSQPTEQDNIKKAKSCKISAKNGETCLLEAMEDIYSTPLVADHTRQVILLTDGRIPYSADVIKLTRENSSHTRCFVFGIGCQDVTSLSEAKKHEPETEKQIQKSFESMQSSGNADVCFMVDCTGSMSTYIDATKTQIINFVTQIRKAFKGINLRISFLGYRDLSDGDRGWSILDFTEDEKEFQGFVQKEHAWGGGDFPEDVNGALQKALDLDWHNPVRILFHVADAPPHGTQYSTTVSGDNYPDGHSKDMEIEKLLTKVKEKNLGYFFGRVNGSCDKMVEIFKRTIDVEVAKMTDSKTFLESISGFTQLSVANSISAAVVRGIARAGGGESEFITKSSELQEKALRHLKRSLQPAITQLQFDWKSLNVTQHPYRLRPLFYDEQYRVYGFVKQQDGDTSTEGSEVHSARLTGLLPNGKEISYEFDIDLSKKVAGNVIHSLAAREAIRDLEESDSIYHEQLENGQPVDIAKATKDEIIRLGTKYNLATTFTSFLAVEERCDEGEIKRDKDPKPPERRDVPSGLEDELEEVSGIMKENIDRVLNRGDRLEDLMAKSADLSATSAKFSRRATPMATYMPSALCLDEGSPNSAGCCGGGFSSSSSGTVHEPSSTIHSSLSRKVLYKIILAGELSVGKSSLLERYIKDEFHSDIKATIGADFQVKQLEINDKIVTAQIWDTAGQERYRSLHPMYMRGADAILLVFDVTNQKSFDELAYWVELIMTHCGDNVLVCVVANKTDTAPEIRKVQSEDAKAFADKIGGMYCECSAKDGVNVEDLFKEIVIKLLEC